MDRRKSAADYDDFVRRVYYQTLPGPRRRSRYGSLHDSAEERLRKTESEKDSLSLHVSVLTDQIDAQSEKIRDLEYSLAERHDKVINTEDMLQSEDMSTALLKKPTEIHYL
ncbi:Hypothetical predicted protein [Mytilus galloprovincialis]|uniref:Liprin-beta-1/2 coiled-coil domain-containing protein n=1 Tax=Mytilus galloprovincialis TaxID=29158 RepID=A0A8B6F375_MYTGA|nr:Hypothetical predicted protein [Mytilus galloprovincialis]